MAIKPPNYTQMPNFLCDDLWLPQLSGLELKVLYVIFRKTLGWHKFHDEISLSQLQHYTGAQRTNIINATKQLEAKGLIKKKMNADRCHQTTTYHLVISDSSKNSDQSQNSTTPSAKIALPPSAKIALPPSAKIALPPSAKIAPTKETSSYEDIKEKGKKDPVSIDTPPAEAEEPLRPPVKKTKREEHILVAEEVRITPTQQANLLKKLGGNEAKLKQCYAKLSEWKIGKNKTGGAGDYLAIIKWVIEAVDSDVKSDIVKPEDRSKANHKYANELKISMVSGDRNTRFDVLSDRVRIESIMGIHARTVEIKYSELGFKDQVNNALSKFGFRKNG